MKNLFIIFLSGILPSVLFSQSLIIKDKSTLQALDNVAVYALHPERKAMTDAKGVLEIGSFSGADSIFFLKAGYSLTSYSWGDLVSMNFEVFLSEVSFDLGEVVISASRFEEKKSDVARQIVVIQSKDIASQNQPTMAEVLSNTGLVMVQKSQLGGGSPIMRGFEANKVLMVVDGVRMNNLIYRGGHLQNCITVDQNMIEKTELAFGAGSVMYGSDALGGAMHFHTSNPILSEGGLKVHGGGFLRYGSAAQEKTGHFDLSLGWKKFGFISSVTLTDFNDLRAGSSRNPLAGTFGERQHYVTRINGVDSMVVNPDSAIQKQTGYTQVDVMEKLLYKPNDKMSHTLSFQMSNTNNVPRYDRLSEYKADSSSLSYAEWYYGPQKRIFGSYAFNWQADKKFADQIRVIAGYQNIEESRVNRRFGSANRAFNIEKVNVLSLNVDAAKKAGKNEVRYGVEAFWNSVASTAHTQNINTDVSTPRATRYPDGGSSMTNLAAFVSHTREISPKLILSDGLRYTRVMLNSAFTDTTFYPFPFKEIKQNSGALNGNLGLVYLPCKDLKIYANASTGFRAPNVDDLSKIFDSSPGSIVVPNAKLKPEYTWNGELGFAGRVQNKVSIEGAGYYTYLTNALVVDKFQFNGQDSILYDGQMSQVTATQNKGQAFIAGGTGIVTADVTDWFSFKSSVTYTYGRIIDNSVVKDSLIPLDHIPPVFGRTSVIIKLKKFRGEFFALYSGWKKIADFNPGGEDNQQYATAAGMPAWVTLNLRAAYQLNKVVQLQFSCENILNQHYRVFASGMSAPGRNYLLTLRARF